VKVKILLRLKVANAQGKEHVRCEVKQTADGIGIIRFVGEFNWWSTNSADQFRTAIDTLKANGVTQLRAYINSPGGSVFEANEIYNLLVAFNKEDDRYLDIGALCCSAATTVAGAFPVKNTRAYQNATVMMHNPTTYIDGEEKDLESGATLLKNLKQGYVKRWSKRMGISESMLSKKMDSTWWFSQEELTKYNIVSSFIDGDDVVPEDTKQVFNKFQVQNIPAVLNKLITEPVNIIEEDEPDNSTVTNFKLQMKNFIVLLMASMTAIKTYLTNENASEAEVVAALTRAFNEKDSKITELTADVTQKNTKITELENKIKDHTTQMIKALLDVAQNTEKKITADQRKVYEEQAGTLGYDGLSKILNAIPARTSVRNQIEIGSGKKNGTKEKEEEQERIEPEFSLNGRGERVYDGNKKSQQEVYARIVADQQKKATGK
jgi:ATP-dependent Clp protease protease subunit